MHSRTERPDRTAQQAATVLLVPAVTALLSQVLAATVMMLTSLRSI